MTMKDIMETLATEIVSTEVFKTAIVKIMTDNIKVSVENVKLNMITEVMEKVRIQTQANITTSEAEAMVDVKLDNILQQKVEMAAERLNLMNKDDVDEAIDQTLRNCTVEADITIRP
jgi:F0F1-type ATP synthase delta subunit